MSKGHNYKPFAEGIPLGKTVKKIVKLLLTHDLSLYCTNLNCHSEWSVAE